jgi:predicted nucleic acid-binding protein
MEFYDGSEPGRKIYDLVEGDENLFTSILTLAEISDNLHSGNFKTDHSLEEIKDFIMRESVIAGLDDSIVIKAGEIKKRERDGFSDFGLMDGIMLATAEENSLELLTGDPHLVDEEISRDIRT